MITNSQIGNNVVNQEEIYNFQTFKYNSVPILNDPIIPETLLNIDYPPKHQITNIDFILTIPKINENNFFQEINEYQLYEQEKNIYQNNDELIPNMNFDINANYQLNIKLTGDIDDLDSKNDIKSLEILEDGSIRKDYNKEIPNYNLESINNSKIGVNTIKTIGDSEEDESKTATLKNVKNILDMDDKVESSSFNNNITNVINDNDKLEKNILIENKWKKLVYICKKNNKKNEIFNIIKFLIIQKKFTIYLDNSIEQKKKVKKISLINQNKNSFINKYKLLNNLDNSNNNDYSINYSPTKIDAIISMSKNQNILDTKSLDDIVDFVQMKEKEYIKQITSCNKNNNIQDNSFKKLFTIKEEENESCDDQDSLSFKKNSLHNSTKLAPNLEVRKSLTFKENQDFQNITNKLLSKKENVSKEVILEKKEEYDEENDKNNNINNIILDDKIIISPFKENANLISANKKSIYTTPESKGEEIYKKRCASFNGTKKEITPEEFKTTTDNDIEFSDFGDIINKKNILDNAKEKDQEIFDLLKNNITNKKKQNNEKFNDNSCKKDLFKQIYPSTNENKKENYCMDKITEIYISKENNNFDNCSKSVITDDYVSNYSKSYNYILEYLKYKIIGKNKILFLHTDKNYKSPKYKIKIKSYYNIVKKVGKIKRMPLSLAQYENLIKDLLLDVNEQKKKLKNANYNIRNDLIIDVTSNEYINKQINNFEKKLIEIKNDYIYVMVKKHYIKDKKEKEKFINNFNIDQKRNDFIIEFKKLIEILEKSVKSLQKAENYRKLGEILENFKTISNEEIKKAKFIHKQKKLEDYRNNENNKKNIHKNSVFENIIKSKNKGINKKKIVMFGTILLPLCYICNYLYSNLKNN